MSCDHLRHTDARDEALGHYSTADVLLTKPPNVLVGGFAFLRVLQVKKRADERTRTADLLIARDHSSVAGVCRGLQMPHF